MSLPYFGGLFPDAAGALITTPAAAAELQLGAVTSSGTLEFARLRARVAGVAGNTIQVSLSCDAADPSEVEIDEGGDQVDIHVLDNATTYAELEALVNTDSSLIEMVGTGNPDDIVAFSDDEFTLTPLTGGTAESSFRSSYWGGHFPDGPDEDPPTVPPTTPEGAATFALRLESGTKVTYAWQTDIFKAYDGKETRAALLDDPRESYGGSAFLAADFALQTRVDIAQHAANGAIFSLGLPWEQTTVEDVSGAVVSLGTTTASLDWAVVGQRVLIHRGASDDTDVADGVIQDVGTYSITLDAEPDAEAAVPGAVIMPLVPILLEPQQAFPRYRTGCERWNLQGRAARFGFPAAAVPGELTMTIGSPSRTVTFRAATAGIDVSISLDGGGASGITLGIAPGVDGAFALAIEAESGTTLDELNSALVGLITLVGDYEGDETISNLDSFSLTALTGADAGGPGEAGRGASVTEIFDRPLWDRGVENASTITDSIHSLTDIVDLGGVPLGVVEATVPDWGRHIAYTAALGADWQWMKAFLAAVKGRWKSFWLPTGRADLEPTDEATSTTLTISGTTGSYDLWAARGYSVLQVQQGDAIHYVRVTGASVDGTDIVLTVEGDTLDAAAVDRLSWCELVHLESDDVEVTWVDQTTFAVALTARVVQR